MTTGSKHRYSPPGETKRNKFSSCFGLSRRSSLGAAALLITFTCTCSGSSTPNVIALKLYRGYTIVARGSIGNLKNLNFLIDTGAVPSILDRRIAKKLRLTG